MTEGPSDADLLRAHLDGDAQAFAVLVRRHRDRLWAVALRTIGDREEAADAVQDALLSAHRNAGKFRGDSAVTTWLHRIVVNACLDRIRRRQAHPTVPLPDGGRDDDRPAAPEPAAPAEDHETKLVVRRALTDLPAEQRAAIVLVDVQGYPVAEAAEILGVAEGTIKSRCARGRARMALALADLRGAPANGTKQSGADKSGAKQSGTKQGGAERTGARDRAGQGSGDAGHAAGGNQQAAQTVPSGTGADHPLPTPAEGRDER